MRRQNDCNQRKQHTSYRNAISKMKCGDFADLIGRHILQEVFFKKKKGILNHPVDSMLNIDKRTKVEEASF